MSLDIVAKRYGVALFQLGQEKSMLDELEKELQVVREVLNQDEKIFTFLTHPQIHADKKKELLEKAFQDFSKEVKNTLFLLVDRRREAAIPAIIDYFFKLNNEARGIAEADVYSVRELNEDEKQTLQNVFAKKLDVNTLRIHNIVDPSILGGLKMKIGNRIYDGSVSGKLERIERKLVSANK
ncbi:ATP synthase F1 subcomplex delta subunit [Melghiribacillus thermohalophilus]|uniref:ATP synthase subunit delta n=1 Tax=Melghiribacillus thermohalophilus TaxID=1324956 RepID=A0A4R3NGU3_9BACI|nr:F0F1 ATP synthase subunit delta [Melghiribacillus thermohalophilus]TCT26407.1 ATP synthase F1 subcomplex delta subunit [Melghiribacillus thermohalophilus]